MRKYWHRYKALLLFSVTIIATVSGLAQAPDPETYRARAIQWSDQMNSSQLADPFVGITVNGEVQPDLFELQSTGVSTQAITESAQAFLETLTAEQRSQTVFAEDDIEWRKWANQHIYFRDGISLETMNDTQRDAVFAMLKESLSAKGLKLSQDIMHLNETLGELNGNNFVEYGQWKYSISIMGEPSTTEPWGWQLDGHHLDLNYFVLGDQVVMTPAFWGSEPAVATTGKFAGTSIMEEEQSYGLDMIRSLTTRQQNQAILETSKTGNNIMTQAFSDNVVLDYAGIRVSEFSASQKQQLLALIGLYVGNMHQGQQVTRMSAVAAHLDDTYFAWIGETDDDAVFYYRIHSPVLLLEFDHETPVGLGHIYAPGVPYKEHIHSVVRTPNGNDYGKDLLRQHYEDHPH
jgi:hypothetical protein